jgi:hypothetical protein
MRYLVVILFLLFAGTVALSQQLPPIKGKSGQPQQPSAIDQRGTQQSPIVVKVLPTPKTNEEATQEAKERNEKEALDRRIKDATGNIAYFNKILAAIAVLQFLTLIFQAWMLRRTVNTSRACERAYVTMLHEGPGVVFETEGLFYLTIKIKNYGRTPAKVTDTLLKPVILPRGEKLPPKPNYIRDKENHESQKAFLVRDDYFIVTEYFDIKEQILTIQEGTAILYLIGYVDYVDAFDKRHRGGYARRYVFSDKTNDLQLVLDGAYTYDRERAVGEGSDWHQDAKESRPDLKIGKHEKAAEESKPEELGKNAEAEQHGKKAVQEDKPVADWIASQPKEL